MTAQQRLAHTENVHAAAVVTVRTCEAKRQAADALARVAKKDFESATKTRRHTALALMHAREEAAVE